MQIKKITLMNPPFENSVYQGELNSKNEPHGMGKIITYLGNAEGSFYEGEWANGLPNGKGTIRYSVEKVDVKYSGVLKNGGMHGEGVADMKTACYNIHSEGTFKNDDFNTGLVEQKFVDNLSVTFRLENQKILERTIKLPSGKIIDMTPLESNEKK